MTREQCRNKGGWVAVGMGIPTGFPYGWEWEKCLPYRNSHMWESCGTPGMQ